MTPEHTFQFRFTSRVRPKHVHFDIISLIDIALVIALFLFVSNSTTLRPAIELKLPKSLFADGVPQGATVVTVTKESLFFFNDERKALGGLESAFNEMMFKNPDAILIIEADKSVSYDLLMKVYNQAQKAGIQTVSLAIDVDQGIGATVP